MPSRLLRNAYSLASQWEAASRAMVGMSVMLEADLVVQFVFGRLCFPIAGEIIAEFHPMAVVKIVGNLERGLRALGKRRRIEQQIKQSENIQ